MNKMSVLGFTIYWNHSQDEPRGPFWEVLDKYQGHEGTDHDEIRLLESQRPFPVNGDHPHYAKIEDQERDGNVVHGNIVSFKYFPGKKK